MKSTQTQFHAVLAFAAQLLLDHFEITWNITKFHSPLSFFCTPKAGPKHSILLAMPFQFRRGIVNIKSLVNWHDPENGMGWDVNGIPTGDTQKVVWFGGDSTCEISLPFSYFEQAAGYNACNETMKRQLRLDAPEVPTIKVGVCGEPAVLKLPPLDLCVKLYRAMEGVPQIISDSDFDLLVPALSAGWKLVTIPNPDRIGILDALMLLRADAPEAVAFRIETYGFDVHCEEANGVLAS